MDETQLRQKLESLSLPQNLFAKLLGVTPRAVTLWLSGERAVPKPVISYLRLFELLTPNLRQVELASINNKEEKMREGMYSIAFCYGSDHGIGVLVFENGQVYGADGTAVKYDGTYTYDLSSKMVDVVLKVTFPPNVTAVFGVKNPYEWSIDVRAKINPHVASGQTVVMTSVGKEISAQYSYLRALPLAA